MKTKLTAICALMLCMGALLFPMTAYAMSDNTPPTISAWLNGDTLHIEAADSGSGVESVYADSHRINYLVDGVVEVNARDNHDNKEQITVYAVDFAGNKSSIVTINNPYYKAESTPKPTQTTPMPNPTPAPVTPAPTTKPTQTPAQQPSTSKPAQIPPVTATPAPAETPTPMTEPTPPSSESGVPADPQPFTPDGTGTVMDNVVQQNDKEFFTIKTPDDNTFYLIIDRQRDSDGVYLLNAVNEDDLKSLAKKGNGSTESAVPAPTTEVKPTPTPEINPPPEPTTPPAKESGGNGTIIFILIAVAVAGGAGYYFKIVRPKQQAPVDDDDDEGEDDYDEPDDDDSDYDFEEDLDDETDTSEKE